MRSSVTNLAKTEASAALRAHHSTLQARRGETKIISPAPAASPCHSLVLVSVECLISQITEPAVDTTERLTQIITQRLVPPTTYYHARMAPHVFAQIVHNVTFSLANAYRSVEMP